MSKHGSRASSCPKINPGPARSNRPLSQFERASLCSDQYLYESEASSKALEAVAELREELDDHLEGLRTMPERICDQDASTKWDVVLLRAEATKMSFGIPGENKCFACDLDNKNTQVHSVPISE